MSARTLQTAVQHHQSGALATAEALYRQVLAADPRNADALHLLGVACSQQGRHDEAVGFIGRAVALAPASAAMHVNLGNALHGARRHEDAVASYRSALALEPGNANAHRNLGSALNALQRHTEAEACFRTAVALRPDFAAAHSGLGLTLLEQERYAEALTCFEQARALRPNDPEMHNNVSGALRYLNRYDEALAAIESALSRVPDHVDYHWYRAATRLALGDFPGGWEDYEWRRHATFKSPPRDFPQPLWLGKEPLAGRTILLHSEQGLGDTLQFVRYAPLVAQRGARVLLLVQPPLQRLLTGLEGVSIVDTVDSFGNTIDFQCPLMSLPYAFGTRLETIPANVPYVRAHPDAAARWRERLGESGPNVGLVWAGAARENDPSSNKIDRRRSMTLAQLAPLANVPAVRFVSLQKGPPALQAREPPPGMNLVDASAELDDFTDTAALVAGLDLVITVDTSVAHLAGAMGKPVWILSRFDGCWRWLLDRDDSPWYPTARLFRQPAVGDWTSVAASVALALTHWSRR